MTASRKHAPRVDDDLERQARAHLQGAATGARAEESREPEPPLNGEPEVAAVPEADTQGRSDIPMNLTPYEIEQRSRFSRYLARSTFPADRHELIRAAQAAGAPDDVIDEVRSLPSGVTFENPARAWAALDHRLDQRF
ncbi:MAG TPA: DUF2795 domain-containing protein [Micromonosporaceae bacterium]|jgi:hypothetical protein